VVLVGAVLVALAILLPFIIMVLNAFKSPVDYSQNGPLSWPTEFYTEGLTTFWERVNFPQKLVNSIWISTAVAILGTLLSLLNAYAIGIGRVKGRLWVVSLFLLATMLPQEALIYPLFTMANEVGLSNSPWSVIIIFTVIQSAFGTYLLASVLGTFPKALLEAAALDGASRWDVLWKVVFPVVRPTLSVLMIFFFIWTWNEFFIPLVMLTTNDTQTIPVALASLQGDRMMDAPTTNAGALVSLIPAVLFFLIFQRTLTRGVTAGSVK
jgi:raffinose/stachyose/melibiose transport system permease protein